MYATGFHSIVMTIDTRGFLVFVRYTVVDDGQIKQVQGSNLIVRLIANGNNVLLTKRLLGINIRILCFVHTYINKLSTLFLCAKTFIGTPLEYWTVTVSVLCTFTQ